MKMKGIEDRPGLLSRSRYSSISMLRSAALNVFPRASVRCGPGKIDDSSERSGRYYISMKYVLLLAATLAASPAMWAQAAPPPYVREGKTIKVSEHVWVIPDGRVNLVPNIGFIVGSKATLVVDSGMGDCNGQVVLGELRKRSKNADLY